MQLVFGLHLDKIRTETRKFKCSSISAAFERANFSTYLTSCNAAKYFDCTSTKFALKLDTIRAQTRRFKCSSISAAFDRANFNPYFVEFSASVLKCTTIGKPNLFLGLQSTILLELQSRHKKNAAQFQLHFSLRISARIYSSCNAGSTMRPSFSCI